MTYDVILERATGDLVLIERTTSDARARELATAVLVKEGPASGAKVHIRRKDSADQLQVSAGGVVLRDQPHLAAAGEALTVHVPTGRVGA